MTAAHPSGDYLLVAVDVAKRAHDVLNQSQGEMRRWWGANDGAGSFSKYG